MKKIGLLGGTGPESTLLYYKGLNAGIDKLTNGDHMPELVIESVDFRRVWGYLTNGQYGELADYLAEKVNNLRKYGAEVVSLTAVTTHIVWEEIAAKTKSSLVSIPQVVSEAVVAKGYKKVGLLGTIFTMEQDYMKKDLREAGVEVFVPQQADRELVAGRIYQELELGIVKESTLQEFQQIIRKMQAEHGIEAIILGCTELPLLLNTENCPVPCLDSVEIHIEELVRQAMAA